MDEEDIAIAVLIGFLIVIFLIVLSLPVKGNIFGMDIELPLIGWIAFAAFAVIALFLFFKHRA